MILDLDQFRRYFVLTKKYLLTFKDEVSYKNPTEVIEMSSCSTVKSADDESYKTNSFVRHLETHFTLETGSEWMDFLHVR